MLHWFRSVAPIRMKFRALTIAYGATSGLATIAAISEGATLPVIGFCTLSLVLTLTLTRIAATAICTPYVDTVVRMEALAAGDVTSPVRYTDHEDCVGRLTKAMDVFRNQHVAHQATSEAATHVMAELGKALDALSSGDMTCAITRPFPQDYDALRLNFNRTVERLDESLSQVAHSAQSVHTGSSEIRAASEDLSQRTEQQAAALEETTAAMRQVTGRVKEIAQGTVEARSAVNAAHRDATEGGEVVRKAVNAMDAIEKSSQEISQIINVIDGISFQTNLLALNAGVEAARAGDAGRGFAVVANEVRALAQRSADAAKDIKALITNSSTQVSEGVTLVGETGKMLARIAEKIGEVNGLIQDIADGTEQQSTNLHQVGSALDGMDRATQQNAAMVEESTAAARSLSGEADELTGMVARFNLRTAQPAARRAPSPAPAPVPVAAPRAIQPMPRVQGNLAVKAEAEDDWTEF